MRHEKRVIDTKRVITHLNHMFTVATSDMERPFRSTRGNANTLYSLQQDFSYFIDEIERGPTYQLPRIIDECNQFIRNITEQHNNSK